jgi:hypothetical protein
VGLDVDFMFNHPDWRVQQSYPPAVSLGSFIFFSDLLKIICAA